ncbi:hypothetical protein [Planktothrix sp. FACHB-1365]|uniref:hypothetical protein n=1 Tax=Planktothrix sp. FACHB-1365 TaxID=2692855 RepID=UPI00168956B1|nr:hypothetical protein [Planktothrix sp. FACHB-1365]MBD2482794.1 hypothetical protein [Planktothrix sp. FACHB-1365]
MTVFYVCLTEQCRIDATKYGVIQDIEKFAEKLKKDQSTRGLDRFPKPYWKKSMARGRIVIEEYPLSEDKIILGLSRFFMRGSDDREYEPSYKDTESFWNKNKVSGSEIEAFLDTIKKTPIPPKKQLSEIESQYLQSISSSYLTDEPVFLESYDWVDRISQDYIKHHISRYSDLSKNIAFEEFAPNQDLIKHATNPNIQILYRYFPEHKRILLISPLNKNKQDDEKELREKYKDILVNSQVELDTIIRWSRRAYPSIIVCDEEVWIQVQNTAEANLALSPEEEKILEKISNPAHGEPRYPLFINGRPGSAKSTILQYLFSEHLTHYKDEAGSLVNPPLYLTYSTPLLEKARSSVKDILLCGAKHLEHGSNSKENPKLKQILDQSFRTFRDFLREKLPHEVKADFVDAKYINFEQFRKEWDKAREKLPKSEEQRNISSGLAWHAIRTFIKGMQNELGAEIDPEFYECELPRNLKSISDNTFQLIYEKIWQRWYKPLCGKEGFWDDQDLAHAVLEYSANELSQYPAVFCDEAQDFTSVELELIQRLSLYSDRQIPSHLAKDVPFAFAGDPFQTLNPTGFNWTATQASFHKNIVQKFDDSSGSAKLEFNYQELSFNYRSSEQIVKLANLIQLLRGKLLDIKGLRPQQSWTRQETSSPVWFRAEDAACKDKIREQKELIIIIPCEENGEVEYIKGDPFLSSFALGNDEKVSRNILSPARAKGLEYKRVLLYKFGEEARKKVPEFLKYLKNINDPKLEPPEIEECLAWEYFLNQFYVAVSRARKRLFIVDSDQALEEFWKLFTDIQKQRELLDLYQSINSNEQWSLENIGGMIQGDEDSWSADRDDPYKLAQNYEAQGRSSRDPDLLDLASWNYHLANCPDKAKLCQAAAYEFREHFANAGNLFKELKQANDACRCYWAGKDVDAIIDLVKQLPEIDTNPRVTAARVIKRDQNTRQDIDNLLTALQKVEPIRSDDSTKIESSAWQWFFKELIIKVDQAITSSGEAHLLGWKPLIEGIVKTLSHLNFSSKDYPDIGKLYFLVGEFQEAVTHWDKCSAIQKQSQKSPTWLLRSRAKIEGYPDNLQYYHQLKDDNAVIEAWRSAGSPIPRETPVVNRILESAVKIGNVEAIRSLLPVCNDIAKVRDLVRDSKNEVLRELRGSISVAINQCLEADSEWEEIVNFTQTYEISHLLIGKSRNIPYSSLNEELKKAKIEWDQSIAIAAAVRVLARSERLVKENFKSQQIISEFLKQHLIIDNNSSPEQHKIMREVHQILSVDEVGSAFERAFKLTFAFEYYEQWYKSNSPAQELHLISPSSKDINLAKRRWMKCKYILAETEQNARSPQLKEEAQKMADQLNVSIDDEPKYLELPDITELNIPSSSEAITPKALILTKDMNEELTIKGLNFIVKTDHIQKQRISLKRVDNGDNVLFSLNKVSSDDVSVKELAETPTLKVWVIEEWDINIESQTNTGDSIISLKTSEGNPIIRIELPKISN